MHRFLVPILGGLAFATSPAFAGSAPRPCTAADYVNTYAPAGYSFLNAPDGKPPTDLPKELKQDTVIGFFGMPTIKYPYGSLKKYGVSVKLIVGVQGRVTCAALAPLRGGDAPAINAQRKAFMEAVGEWRFMPFQLDGDATPVAMEMPVFEEEMPDKHVDMPAGDPTQMTLVYDRHGGSYGPSFHVELHGDGAAFFMQTEQDDALGPQVYRVDPKTVQALLSDAGSVDFWSLRDLYREDPTDFPANFSRVSITIGGVTKSVTGYETSDAGEPGVVRDLDEKIEKAANVKFWQAPTMATLDQLKAQRFDFTSARAARLLLDWTADSSISEDVPLAMMQMGAPLQAEAKDQNDNLDLLEAALGAGRVEIGRRLIAAGLLLDAQGKPDPEKVNRDFIAAINSGDPAAVDLVSPFHPSLTAPDQLESSKPVSVLFKLREITVYPRPPLVPLAERLIAMGADVNARDGDGATLLMAEDDPALVTFLLDHGADVNATTDDGSTALAWAGDQDIALLLLSRGADPRKGQTSAALRKHVKIAHWHKVKAWLEGHGFADVLIQTPGDEDR